MPSLDAVRIDNADEAFVSVMGDLHMTVAAG